MAEDNKSKLVDAVVKASEGIAEAGGAVSRFTNFCKQVMGEPLRELGGIFTDQFAMWRLRNRLRLVEQVEELHRRWNVKQLRLVAPKLALPIIEAASLEEEDDLRLRYACLLANYADATSTVEPTPAFKQMLDGLTGPDLAVMRALYDESVEYVSTHPDGPHVRGVAYAELYSHSIAKRLGIATVQEVLPALDNLARLYCITQSGGYFGLQDGQKEQPYFANPTTYQVTALGEGLLLACDPDLRAGGRVRTADHS